MENGGFSRKVKNSNQQLSFYTYSGIKIDSLYNPDDFSSTFLDEIGFPGQFPFTRGIYPLMYRKKLWTVRQYAGFGSAEETNQRFRYLLNQGQDSLSVAFDLPTQLGLDSDHPSTVGEVGRVGVAIDTLSDMEKLFEAIPLERISTSMTINAPAAIILCMYIATAEKQGISKSQLTGTIQNDILKEYIARGTYIFPPSPSIRILTDILQFSQSYLPKFKPISISGYHIREAGATAVQEIAFCFANGIAYLDAALEKGLKIDKLAPSISFFFSVHNDFFEEIAKFRAARRIWATMMKNDFHAKDPDSWKLRVHTQTAGSTLSEQEPLNNTVRVSIQALAAILGGTQSLHTNSWDEALSLPSKESAKLALRTQQIIGTETGVTNTIDPLGGSFYLETLTDQLEQRIYDCLNEVASLGGAVEAIQQGYMQRKVQQSSYQFHLDSKQRQSVYSHSQQERTNNELAIKWFKTGNHYRHIQNEKLLQIKQQRSQTEVDRSLAKLFEAANDSQVNLMPFILEAVKSYCTVGEISDVFRHVFGEEEES